MKKIIGAKLSDLIVMRGVCQRYFKNGQNLMAATLQQLSRGYRL